jgi:hypothetical protein
MHNKMLKWHCELLLLTCCVHQLLRKSAQYSSPEMSKQNFTIYIFGKLQDEGQRLFFGAALHLCVFMEAPLQ